MLEGNVVGLFYSLKERKKRILEDEATALQVAYRQCGAFNTPCDCDQTTKWPRTIVWSSCVLMLLLLLNVAGMLFMIMFSVWFVPFRFGFDYTDDG